MELNIHVEAEQINKAISEAVLQSTLGDDIRKAIDKVREDLQKSAGWFTTAIEKNVQNCVNREIDKILSESRYNNIIREAIKKKFEAQILEDLVQQFLNKVNISTNRY